MLQLIIRATVYTLLENAQHTCNYYSYLFALTLTSI